MNASGKSLRKQIDKWLGPVGSTRICVTRIGRYRSHRSRCVCVEAWRSSGAFSIVFFRHDDGAWHVYPQPTDRPMMNVYQRAA